MKVAVHTFYTQQMSNRLFNLADGMAANRESSVRYNALKGYLTSQGIEIRTYDAFAPNEKIDCWIFIDPPGDIYRFMARHRINPLRSLLFLVEPPVGNPSLYARQWLYFRIFGRVLSWNSNLVSSKDNFSKFLLPYRFEKDRYPYYLTIPKRNLCVMMHSNKMSPLQGELYSLRRKIITFFEQQGDSLLGLYGAGWNDGASPNPFFSQLYKGWIDDKRECISSYHYSFCIDNMIIPGYLTYDPFISMSVGTVPIYLPMPDSAAYIPRDTYVDFSSFESMDDLVNYLQSLLKSGEYEEMRKQGWQFINSPSYYPFTVEKFCKDVYDALITLAERSNS